ncbi:hypothetical protein HU200_063789 [Digitaria exilis]|uniref:Chalcone synthase n=1 Tax=Digitaria exilis TaxID=1010633 RepID=A0A835A179_9POAL|nr:hypothetical protein HU200_063789 [Digitaria exilis]
MDATARLVSVLQESQKAPRRNSSVAVLAIGTANPANCILQEDYADWYFRVTKSDHLTALKNKMKRICDKSGVKKRYFHYTEETLAGRPELFLDPTLPSLSARLAIAANAIPELAAAAATKVIAEWGRPAGDITHLVVSTNSGAQAPGADLRLAELLGLRPTVQRTLLSLHGCFGGCSALRLAMDIAGSNRGARVLVAVAEATTVLSFRPPVEGHPDALVAAALFGDGAGAVIIGDDDSTATNVERPIFYMVSASQVTLPGTEDTLSMRLQEDGYDIGISVEAPAIIRDNIEGCVANMLAPLGLAGGGWNGLFWPVHPGGRAILDSCQAAFGLEPGKLAASRHVLSEYGNMYGATIIFVLNEIRRRRRQDREQKLGVMMGIGPGVSIEMMVLLAAGVALDSSFIIH